MEPSTILTLAQYDAGGARVAERVTLLPGEVFRAPGDACAVRVLSGSAWVSLKGRDLFLHSGEEMPLSPEEDDALVSSLRPGPLVVQFQGEDPRCTERLKISGWRRLLARSGTRPGRGGRLCA